MPSFYTVMDSRAVSTAITILEITAPATTSVEIIRAWVNQESSVVSAQAAIQIVRKTATITGTAVTPVKTRPFDPTSTVTAKRTATAEGTDGDVLLREGFNVLNGWLYLPVPEERIWIAPSGLLALRFPVAPANVTYNYGITYAQYG